MRGGCSYDDLTSIGTGDCGGPILVSNRGSNLASAEALFRHEWPGNVREWHNALERATIVCEGGLIRVQDLSLAPPPMVPAVVGNTELNVVERQAIERAMRSVSGNKAKAARQLGISRTQLYTRLRKHGLKGAGA